jgi:hypothetical protein
MLRYNLVMLAVGGLTMAAITPRDQADAQSGQSLVFAERGAHRARCAGSVQDIRQNIDSDGRQRVRRWFDQAVGAPLGLPFPRSVA